mmetsp:Transcript_90726/g.142466  ORF Transcript_90726/g.142466 Transcript_90726/m.142466 type:complete len:419 (-) Transcript_90726:87-1343(-)
MLSEKSLDSDTQQLQVDACTVSTEASLSPDCAARKLYSVEELFDGARQPRARNALHVALSANDSAAVARLIDSGDELLLNQPSPTGVTPLMLISMGHCDEELLWKLLEKRGSATIATYSETRRSAADYAKECNRSSDVVDTLRQMETAEKMRTAAYRCPVCGDVARRRPLLRFFGERADKGTEDNRLLRSFFSDRRNRILEGPQYHQFNDMKKIRKELSESLAVLEALESDLPNFGADWHIVDLCCGKALTGLLASIRHPGVSVSLVDRLEPRFVPHVSVGEQNGLKYSQLDVMDDFFIANLECLLREAARPTALLGMHLCGKLSWRAIEAFQQIQSVHAVVLSPCCLPLKSDRDVPAHLYSTKDDGEQYNLWAVHLRDRLRDAVPNVSVSLKAVSDILSPKNIVICATKPSANSSQP